MKKRAEIIISGRVQKAGFRNFIDELAFDMYLTGYVKNLSDGTVQVICEGEEEPLREFVRKINIDQYPIRVEHVDVTYTEPTLEYKTFEIIRVKENFVTATYERMDTAVRYMRLLNLNLGNKIDGLGEKIDELGEKIDRNNTAIHEMNSSLGEKIDRLGEKIDRNNTAIHEMNSSLGEKIDRSRTEISSEIRISRDNFRSHLDERVSILEREFSQIKAKFRP